MRRKAQEDDRRITVVMPADLWRRLRLRAVQEDVSTPALVNRLLEQGLAPPEASCSVR